jgi:PadR family transcriptional regulator PadR
MCEETMKKWLSQVRKGTLELCLLGLIKSKEVYAFELIQELEKVDGLVLTEGTIYPLLKRLQSESLITSFWCESDSGPPRKYYRITEHGADLFNKMKHEWTQFTGYINNILERSENSGSDENRNSGTNKQIPLEVRAKP